jgi:hypothetical protein
VVCGHEPGDFCEGISPCANQALTIVLGPVADMARPLRVYRTPDAAPFIPAKALQLLAFGVVMPSPRSQLFCFASLRQRSMVAAHGSNSRAKALDAAPRPGQRNDIFLKLCLGRLPCSRMENILSDEEKLSIKPGEVQILLIRCSETQVARQPLFAG